MSPNWRFCLKVGALVAVVDFATLMLSRGQSPASELRAAADLVGLLANVALFSHAGFRTGMDTGRATAAAEAGVLASLLPAILVVLYHLFFPEWMVTGAEQAPLVQRVVGSVATNIVLGGVSAWLSGWLASRGRTRQP